ncbi:MULTISPECIES: virulence factor family protein [unclassified Aureimonas]|uniref:virulence factor family protein n=1 Tax=unclassified Aureimonas TaxID=2615206 RepID=UPI0006FA8ECC|nr:MULTISPECIES: AcvB/VirJ family lysyl-phosphatidylglycerol hydrolase [unclassified Aureimonas]KQT69618.1 type IV secretory pathway protein AcvB [Aureimonas sp. Leaf427]KQT80969.1 type IV secretory pathway protein AcvB [Aureimonas sp. Leaf460]
MIAHWKRLAVGAGLAALALSPALAQDAVTADAIDLGSIPSPHIAKPTGEVKALVVLLSDKAGWGAAEDALSATLTGEGAYVLGIDLPSYLASLEKKTEDGDDNCVYTVSDIEEVSQEIQRSAGGSLYHLPIVAGIGAGGAMALSIAAQTPNATIGRTIAVDPARGIALKKDLCTPALRKDEGGLAVYGLTEGEIPNPIDVRFTEAADDGMRAHVADLVAEHSDIDVDDSSDSAADTLAAALKETIETPDEDELGLPLTLLEAKPTLDTMAIIISGDGGWRDLDKDIGDVFQKEGLPTVGVDSLRYFWSEKKPEEVAADLGRIIELFTKRWGVKHVVLVGYSFGADVMPTAYNLLKPAEKSKVALVSLLALSNAANFQISVSGWLGVGSSDDDTNTREIAKMDPKLVQCLYGTEDDETVCPALKATGIELLTTEGGHHFDGDYAALADRIIAGLKTRLGPS